MKHLLALILVTVFVSAPSFAEDAPNEGKKAKSPWQVMKLKKLLKPVTLTAEQETGFAEALQAYSKTIAELEGKGLTKEKLKERGQKRKQGRESGLKGAELQSSISAGFSEEELDMFKELDAATKTADRAVAKLLTDQQTSALPKKCKNGWPC